MKKSKIFIASSGRALTLAKKMRDELSAVAYAEADVWTEVSQGLPSRTIIEMLEETAKKYDFAVIILTQDDVVIREGAAEEKRKARDNCIFEAGLFMGTLGRGRCFLMTDVESDALPSDLQGIIYKHIDKIEEEDFPDPEKCRRAIRQPSAEILDVIYLKGQLEKRNMSFPLLSSEELSEKDRSKSGDLLEGRVVVASSVPFETQYKHASQILKNMENGVRYMYIFRADEYVAQATCNFLQNIILADLLEPEKEYNFKQRFEKIIENKELVIEKFRSICNYSSLKIYFVQDEPPIQFCLYNANSVERAQAYLKVGKDFIKWADGPNAYNFYKNFLPLFPRDSREAIFCSTVLSNINELDGGRFKKSLDMELKNYFPEIHEQVKKLCYGEQ